MPLRDVLREVNSAETTGSIVVEQSPELKGMAVLAQLSITYHRYPQASYIDEEFAMPDPSGSQTLRTVTGHWGRASVLSITSLSESTQEIRIDCLTNSERFPSRTIELGPGATLITPACTRDWNGLESLEKNTEEESTGGVDAVGIELVSSAAPGRFAAFGFSRHRRAETLTFGAIPFNDPKMVISTTTVYTGVPVGVTKLLGSVEYKPYITIANFAQRPARIIVSFSRTSGEAGAETASSVEVGHFTVPAKRTTILSLADLRGDAEMRNAFFVSSDAGPGEVATTLAANTANENDHEVELLGKDAKDPTNAGAHPWSISNGNASTLFLFNQTAQEEHADVTIASDRWVWQKTLTLAPFETKAIDIRRLKEDGTRDGRGRTLQTDVVEGQIDWVASSSERIKGRLLLRNNANGMARSFSCAAFVVLCGASVSPTSATLQIGGSTSFVGNAISCVGYSEFACSGSGSAGGMSYQYSWSTSGSSVSLSTGCSGSASCTASGVSPGISSITFQAQSPSCVQTANASAAVNPAATVTVHFTGSKTTGDNLKFAGTPACSENLGLFNCTSSGFWVWNVEIESDVTDDASKWTVKQSFTGRKKGFWKDSTGVLHSFDQTLNVSNDNPSSSFVQQPTGKKVIFWIDAPGHGYNLATAQPIDSLTQVQNFTSTVCSTVTPSACYSQNWYLKLVIKPGKILDTANSKAAFGSASTNF